MDCEQPIYLRQITVEMFFDDLEIPIQLLDRHILVHPLRQIVIRLAARQHEYVVFELLAFGVSHCRYVVSSDSVYRHSYLSSSVRRSDDNRRIDICD